ncbi:hypothetical protein Terro_0356 [Terriglobus roseus DSM 18391]|uniref:Uncharacterized protein n=1 Tax=Terriglobus roseus (strain DSM 18391 / NRRL B-41598 / KBS 63) TaxID=926566 RepID=I3ZBT7_TERRK|nr:hypothetical protein [Terriglobus roseus]AFL86705.1 hypothetical protein Terro_0356 [Terriglobus roseus DSM 18391]
MIAAALSCLGLFIGVVFGGFFVLLRRRHRERRRKQLDPGFYPTTRDLGNALHSLQTFARPEIAHVMEVKQAEPKEDEANGDDRVASDARRIG